MATTSIAEQNPATPAEIWATLDRVAKYHEETAQYQKETAQRQKENDAKAAKRWEEDTKRWKEADRQRVEDNEKWKQQWEKLRAMLDKTSRRIGENDKRVGGLGRSYGKLVEHLVGPGIVRRFGEHGYHFDGIKKQRYKLRDEDGKEKAEIDLLLENDDTVIAVEVKTRPDREEAYLGRHLVRLGIMREHSRAEGWDGKRILGAIAGAIFDTPVKNATLKAGIFVIEQSGETMRMDMPEGFKPKEW